MPLIVSLFTQNITQPIKRLTKIATDVKGDKQFHPLYLADITNGKNEIAQLAKAFSKTIIKLQHQFNELNKIHSMGQIIISTLDPKETPQTILRVVKQITVFDAAEICIFKGAYLEVIAWSGEREFRNTVGEKYKIGWGLTGMIAKKKETIFQPTIPTNKQELQLTLGYESISTELPSKSVRIEVQSFLGVPLLIGKRLIGCLTLVHRKPGHFTREDLGNLDRLMSQAAIALDNTFRVQKREQTLRAKIKELNVEIDDKKVKDQVAEITETEYFRSLQANIAKLRERKRRR